MDLKREGLAAQKIVDIVGNKSYIITNENTIMDRNDANVKRYSEDDKQPSY